MDIKVINDRYSISEQISPADLDALAADGVSLVVNFRPDGEGGETQPTSQALAEKAAALGLAYAHIPVIPNQIQPDQVQQLHALLSQHTGRVHGFCRTGNRAQNVYQQAQQLAPAAAQKPACCCQPGAADEGLLDKVKGWFKA